MFLISINQLGFFSECFFLSPEINWVFFGNRQQSNARWAEKSRMFFFGNVLPKSDARAHFHLWPGRGQGHVLEFGDYMELGHAA